MDGDSVKGELTELSEHFGPLIEIILKESFSPDIDIDINVDKYARAQVLADITVSEDDFDAAEKEKELIRGLRDRLEEHGIETVKIKKTYKDGREKLGLRIKKFIGEAEKNAARSMVIGYLDYAKYFMPYIAVKKGKITYSVKADFNIEFEEIYEKLGLEEGSDKRELIENTFIRVMLSLPVEIQGSGLNIRDGKTMVWDINPPENIDIKAEFTIPSLKRQPLLELFVRD